MVRQIKIFGGGSWKGLEREVNEFLKLYDAKDIVSVQYFEQEGDMTVMVVYEETF